MTPVPQTADEAAFSLSALAVQPAAEAPLSPAQRRFNELLARIDALTGQIQRLEAWSDRHRLAHLNLLREAVQQAQKNRKTLLFVLHDRLQSETLTAQHQRMARGKVRALLAELTHSAQSPDPQVQALLDLYVSEEEVQEEAQARAEAAERVRARLEEALGQAIEKPSQYQTPDEMLAAGMRQWQRQQQAADERKAAKRAARKAQKKSAATGPGDAAAAAPVTDAKSTLRTLYRQLARSLHPDRATDESERVHKTALMSEVNAAYEKNDLTTLMRLQWQALRQGLSAAPTGAESDAKWRAMAELLKEQLAALEDDLDHLQHRLSRELCVPVRASDDEAQLTRSLQRVQAEQRQVAELVADDLRCVQSDAEWKRWLKAQWQLAKEQGQQARED
jgi:hypothetical protein